MQNKHDPLDHLDPVEMIRILKYFYNGYLKINDHMVVTQKDRSIPIDPLSERKGIPLVSYVSYDQIEGIIKDMIVMPFRRIRDDNEIKGWYLYSLLHLAGLTYNKKAKQQFDERSWPEVRKKDIKLGMMCFAELVFRRCFND